MYFNIVGNQYFLIALLLLMPPLQEVNSRQSNLESKKQTVEDSEEYVVLSRLLITQYDHKDIKSFVIVEDTASVQEASTFIGTVGGWIFSGAKRPEVEQETSADYDAKAQDSFILSNKLTLSTPYHLVSAQDLRQLFHRKGESVDSREWKSFYEKYPGSSGIIAFSRVGFNKKRNQALVYVMHQSGLVGGSGVFYVLSKQSGFWEVQNQAVIWLS